LYTSPLNSVTDLHYKWLKEGFCLSRQQAGHSVQLCEPSVMETVLVLLEVKFKF